MCRIWPHCAIPMEWHSELKSSPLEDKDEFILHHQNHDFWWAGDVRRQVTISHGIDLVPPETSRDPSH